MIEVNEKIRKSERFPAFSRLARGLRWMNFDFSIAARGRKPKVDELMRHICDDKGELLYEECPEAIIEDDCDPEDATLLTSRLRLGRHRAGGKGMHRVVLDLDMDAALIPSSTPGHHHLIIDKAMEWPKYEKLLDALADAGVIEKGYARGSIQKGYTAIRPPWVKKSREGVLDDPFI